jgi:23S rRNA pseudouridine1911/1915/1917 synthase
MEPAKMPRNINLSISSSAHKTRLDTFLKDNFSEHSRSFWKKRIESGDILINGKIVSKSGYILKEGDSLEITIPDPERTDILPEDIPLEIIYEDEQLVVVNKPAGMPVHPGAGHHSGTLVNALLHHYGKKLSMINGIERPGIVHRLDMNTSGLLVVAKNDTAHNRLASQFAEKSAGRIYNALAWFPLEEAEGTIITNIARHSRERKKMAVRETGKEAVTYFKNSERFSFCNLLELKLGTGRTHQIRVHLQYYGHPVFGDDIYGGGMTALNHIPVMERKFARDLLKRIPSLLLHARELSFVHPVTEERMTFETPLPKYFSEALRVLRERDFKIS